MSKKLTKLCSRANNKAKPSSTTSQILNNSDEDFVSVLDKPSLVKNNDNDVSKDIQASFLGERKIN